MLTICLSPEATSAIRGACLRAGTLETGGMLLAERTSEDVFRVIEATTASAGRFASFVRVLADGLTRLEDFLGRKKHDYTRFNYLGEWHSHPSFAIQPSRTDDATMREIVGAPETTALFVVLLIVRLDAGNLRAGVWAYFPTGERVPCSVFVEQDSGGASPQIDARISV